MKQTMTISTASSPSSPSNNNSINNNKQTTSLTAEESENAIQSLVNIIQFETVSATAPASGEYIKCANYIKEQLESIPCLDDVHFLPEAPDHSPVVIGRWKGRDETLPVVLLNSHYDVVPANQDDWNVPCFEGVRKDGRIYGRGAQDMKCV